MSHRLHNIMLAGALLLLTPLLLAGCASDPTEGYAWESTFPQDITTVAVPIFQNDTFVRDIEFELTDAVIKEITARTPYRVTPTAKADTILLGYVRQVELDQISKSELTGLGEEVLVRVTIDFQWKDLRTDRTITERMEFTGNGLFDPSKPTAERIELGRMAVVQQLSRDVVTEMRTAW